MNWLGNVMCWVVMIGAIAVFGFIALDMFWEWWTRGVPRR